MDQITIRMPDDFHVHFRRGQILRTVVPYTAQQFGRAMVMPNTAPKPILTAEDATEYYGEIREVVKSLEYGNRFEPLMTIQIIDETTPEIIYEATKRGFIIAGKVYPKGVTTNSHNGVSDFKKLYRVFAAMQDAGMVLSLHGQVRTAFCLDREKGFLDTLISLARDFPQLRIVMEHISTKESVNVIKHLPHTVAATITAHHLILTLNNVLSHVDEDGSEGICPHHYCQPILQGPEDQHALANAILSGDPKFFFGSDTAPHLRERKETACGCAGIFTAPVLLPVLAENFSQLSELQRNVTIPFENFVSHFGAQFYHLQPNVGTITIAKEPWIVPKDYDGIVPLFAGKQLNWKVVL